MKIVRDNDNTPRKRAEDISSGECFELNGKYYIMTEERADARAFAVNLETGEKEHFWENVVVTTVEAKIIISG